MMSNLLIVESPSKARTIKKYLGKGYQILASVGHIKNLPEKDLGINIPNDFKPKYVTIKGKHKIIQRLCTASKDADKIFLATDPDREGEAIAWHIANVLKVPNDRISRVLFNEITTSGIKAGMSHPRRIDINLVNAQQARRILDRIVGYQISPFLWKILYRGLSAGRVQSIALRLICEREEEIDNFIPREYWEIEAKLKTKSYELFLARCIKIEGKQLKIPDEESVKKHVEILNKSSYMVKSITRKEKKKYPAPPFTTSTLQQESTRRLRLSPIRTMRIAQELYEGIEIDQKPVGLITYMRTDSVRIAYEAASAVRKFITERYGTEYLPEKVRYFKSTKKGMQDAHEGIRPTRFDLPPDKVSKDLNSEQIRLYTLIWNRFVSCQMSPAVFKQTNIDIQADKYLFRTVGSELLFDGYLRAWSEEKKEKKTKKIPEKIKEGDLLDLISLTPEQKFTEPSPPYTDGTIIKDLDSLGIGRPSTYASIISTILQRKYIERKKAILRPTDLGKTVNKILIDGMPDIFNVNFTAKMEEELDNIESGNEDWLTVVRRFYKPFRKSLDVLDSRRKEIRVNLQEKTDEICKACGSPMVIKWSKNGRFLACSAFPKCRNARPLTEDTETIEHSKPCPKCKSPMILRDGRFGKFWSCSAYPKCKTTLPYTLNIPCPESGCSGQLVERRTKKGYIFYGCSLYPNCKFATWNQPLDRSCSNCGHPILENKETRNRGTIIVCPKCKTEYSNSN